MKLFTVVKLFTVAAASLLAVACKDVSVPPTAEEVFVNPSVNTHFNDKQGRVLLSRVKGNGNISSIIVT